MTRLLFDKPCWSCVKQRFWLNHESCCPRAVLSSFLKMNRAVLQIPMYNLPAQGNGRPKQPVLYGSIYVAAPHESAVATAKSNISEAPNSNLVLDTGTH